MAKVKHQKSKPSRQPRQINMKKRGKQNDVSELLAQLDVLGLKIIQVTPDGNCFFRALADQLEGDEDEHQKYRSMVAWFMQENRDMFEPFAEDEVPFDDYCHSIGEDGTWAGHMELQAASLVTRCNICIHRHMSPRWYIQNFDKHEVRMIHLSYHDGEHYNSVRTKDDTCSGPARPIVIKGDAALSVKSDQPKAAARKSTHDGGKNIFHGDSIKLVKAGSGCEDARQVEQALQSVGRDVDAAIEVLVAEKEPSNQIVFEDQPSPSVKTSCDESQDENSEQRRLTVEDHQTCKPDLSGNDAGKNYKPNMQKNSRNKSWSKSSCGSVAGRSAARLPVKSRKGRKTARRVGRTVPSSDHSVEGEILFPQRQGSKIGNLGHFQKQG